MTEQFTEPAVKVDELLARKAAAIATFVGGDYGMTTSVGPEGSGWHWDFGRNHVNMDAHDLLYEPEAVVKGVASHEGNHRLASRAEHVQDMWREPGFSFGYNAVEDPRANMAGIYHRPGTRSWIKAYIERDLDEGGGLNYQHLEEGTKEQLGYVPPHMKWGAEMIRYWHAKELADMPLGPGDRQAFLDTIPDLAVRNTVAKTLDSFEKYYQTIPGTTDETEVQRKAAQSSAAFKNDIWPEYQKLVEQAYDDQAVIDMLKDMIQANKDDEGDRTNIPFNSLPPEIQDEIKQKMQNQSPSGSQDGQSNQNGDSQASEASDQTGQSGQTGSPEQSGSGEGQEGHSTQSSAGNQPGQTQSSQSSPREDTTGQTSLTSEKDDSTGQTSQQTPVPWDELSDSAKQTMRNSFSSLDQGAKDNYKQQAQSELEDAEDKANEKLRGNNDPSSTETHKEMREREAQENLASQESQDSQVDEPQSQTTEDAIEQKQRQQAKKSAAQQMIREMQKRRREAEKEIRPNSYQAYLNDPEVRTAMIQIDSEFRRIFTPNELPGARYTYSGLRPAMSRAMQFEADPRKSSIFETHGRPREKSHRFLWNGDLSSSMSEIVEFAFKAIVIGEELANKHGLETAVTGFSTSLGNNGFEVFKDFEPKKLTRLTREKLGTMPNSVGGGTPLYRATQVGYAMLKARNNRVPMKSNFFQTFTDGSPTDASQQDLTELVKTIRKDREVITSGFGIGPGTDYVDDVYPQLPKQVRAAIARKINKSEGDVSNSFTNVSDFARAFVIIMRHQVEQPELFYS